MTRSYGDVVVTEVVDVPIQIGKRTLNIQLLVSPHVEDCLVLGPDVVSIIKVSQGQLLLTLENGEVIDTLTKDNPFRMLFEAIYVSEEGEQAGSNWRIKEDEQASTASRVGVSESASNRKDSEQQLRSCKGAEQQLVSRSEPSTSQVEEREYVKKFWKPDDVLMCTAREKRSRSSNRVRCPNWALRHRS